MTVPQTNLAGNVTYSQSVLAYSLPVHAKSWLINPDALRAASKIVSNPLPG